MVICKYFIDGFFYSSIIYILESGLLILQSLLLYISKSHIPLAVLRQVLTYNANKQLTSEFNYCIKAECGSMLIFHISFCELSVDTILRIILLLISTILRPTQKLFGNVIFVIYIDPSIYNTYVPVLKLTCTRMISVLHARKCIRSGICFAVKLWI